MRQCRILVSIGYYLPAYRSGGPIRTIANIVHHLSDQFQFLVLACDRDLGDHHPFPGIVRGIWQEVDKAKVMYLSPRQFLLWPWRKILCRLDYDILYLNGFFSTLTIQTLFLRRLGLLPNKPIIIAPRGEFSPGALILKRTKKLCYLFLTKALGLLEGLFWQASSQFECEEITSVISRRKSRVMISIAPDLLAPSLVAIRTSRGKVKGELRAVFLSRLSRKKNLHFALNLLSGVHGCVVFDVFGPIEDSAYWEECRTIIARLPDNIQVTYRGEISPTDVTEVMSQYHVFLFPTLGENYGHVIVEAMMAGCPVVISNTTPWRNLETSNAGWVFPLSEPERFQEVLTQLTEMDACAFQKWSEGARAYAENVVNDPRPIDANRRLFINALSNPPTGSGG